MKNTVVFKKKSYKHTMNYSVDSSNYELITERDVPISTLRRRFAADNGGEPADWTMVGTETVIEKWEMPMEDFKMAASYSCEVEN